MIRGRFIVSYVNGDVDLATRCTFTLSVRSESMRTLLSATVAFAGRTYDYTYICLHMSTPVYTRQPLRIHMPLYVCGLGSICCYIWAHMYIYIYMYICTHIYIYMQMRPRMQTMPMCLHTSICIYMHLYIYVYMCIYIYMLCVRGYMCIHICKCIYIYKCN